MRDPVIDAGDVLVFEGDCLDVLAEMPDNSIDAIVTDPPYGLGFMGKAWDDLPPGEPWARECLRVLKPGGHLLAFGGSRTWHRLAVAVEDAGFEVRDSIAWLYGSGFPKSLDVSKAIDKARVEDKEPTRIICRAIRAAMDAKGLRSRDLVEHFDGCHPRLIDHWAARDTDSQPALPKWEQWETLRVLFPELAEHDAEVWRLNGRKGTPGEAWDQREVIGSAVVNGAEGSAGGYANGIASHRGLGGEVREIDITAPATPAALQWQGWGTALKPAFEPIVVARKPLTGTVAANVLAHGTGALNIDGCRVGSADNLVRPAIVRKDNDVLGKGLGGGVQENPAGRWPANVVLDESQATALDEQTGAIPPSQRTAKRDYTARDGIDGHLRGVEIAEGRQWGYDDSGGASRFFYVAKAPTRERPKVDGVAHPTVKPLALMRWLVRLVTPPGGTVLDTFAGSGATLEAARLEGFDSIGIEREADYLPLIEVRLDRSAV